MSAYAQSGLNDIVSDTISLNLRNRSSVDTNVCNIFPKTYSSKKVALVLSGAGPEDLHSLE
jgi:hypothetical protein